MRHEVVRGIRLGVILLTGLLAGVASYRVLHSFSAQASEPRSVDVPAVPDAAVANPADTPVVPDVPPFTAPPPVPPPPPVSTSRPAIHRRIARSPVVDQVPVTNTIIASAPADPAPSAPPVEAASTAAPVAQPAASPTVVQQEESPAPEEPGIENAPPKHENRGMKMLKAVGHFLHITHKPDPDQQALRQP